MERQPAPYRRVILVCGNLRDDGRDACGNRGSAKILERLKIYVREKGLNGKIRVTNAGCLNQCAIGPNVVIMPDNLWLKAATLEDADRIIAEFVDPLAKE